MTIIGGAVICYMLEMDVSGHQLNAYNCLDNNDLLVIIDIYLTLAYYQCYGGL